MHYKADSRPFQPVVRSGAAYNLTYRGGPIVDPAKPVEVPVKPVTYNLTYRGVTYLVNRDCVSYRNLSDGWEG